VCWHVTGDQPVLPTKHHSNHSFFCQLPFTRDQLISSYSRCHDDILSPVSVLVPERTNVTTRHLSPHQIEPKSPLGGSSVRDSQDQDYHSVGSSLHRSGFISKIDHTASGKMIIPQRVQLVGSATELGGSKAAHQYPQRNIVDP
jgi:hypothetical protein